MQANRRYIDIINHDSPFHWINKAEQGHRQRRFTCKTFLYTQYQWGREYLPLPVRPRSPIFSRGLIWNETPWSTAGNSGEYFTTRFSTEMRAASSCVGAGQYAGGLDDSISAGGSCGKSKYSTTRSIELIQRVSIDYAQTQKK